MRCSKRTAKHNRRRHMSTFEMWAIALATSIYMVIYAVAGGKATVVNPFKQRVKK